MVGFRPLLEGTPPNNGTFINPGSTLNGCLEAKECRTPGRMLYNCPGKASPALLFPFVPGGHPELSFGHLLRDARQSERTTK